MKKINKNDFKKMALMGIAGGTALAAQASAGPVADTNNYSQMLAFAGCGGSSHGCGGNVAYRTPSNGSYYSGQYYYQNGQSSSGCQAMTQSAGCNSSSQPQYYQPSQGGCAGMAQPQYYQSQPQYYQQQPQYYQQQSSQGCNGMTQPNSGMNRPQAPAMAPSTQPAPQVSYGCGAMNRMQGMPNQAIAGCSSAPNPSQQGQGQMPNQPSSAASVQTPNDNVNKGDSYTQWETADNYQPMNSRSRNSSQQTSNLSTSVQQSAPSSAKSKMSESDMMSQLNAQGKAAYQGLDAAGKAMALKMANQDCKAQNECKGMNSCKTEDHACAGKGSCAGTAAAPFKDKNLAVKVAAMKMAEKRASAAPSKY